jgi:hypothetical protein
VLDAMTTLDKLSLFRGLGKIAGPVEIIQRRTRGETD